MERFSSAWCAAWTAAAAEVELTDLEPFCVDEVLDTGSGTRRVRLNFDGLVFTLTPVSEGASAPHATITIAESTAAALASGALSPAEALTQGLVKVAGDLAAVVAAQAALGAVGERVATLNA